jgi:hypothetical protein
MCIINIVASHGKFFKFSLDLGRIQPILPAYAQTTIENDPEVFFSAKKLSLAAFLQTLAAMQSSCGGVFQTCRFFS